MVEFKLLNASMYGQNIVRVSFIVGLACSSKVVYLIDRIKIINFRFCFIA